MTDAADGADENVEALDQLFRDALADDTDASYRRLQRSAKRLLAQERRDLKGFERRLLERWGEAIDRYDLCLVLARDLGAKIGERWHARATNEQDYVFLALTRLHARACQVAAEVRALLVAGFAAGAHGRWRTLHELAVVACIISENGREVAERYVGYEAVDAHKAAMWYERYAHALGYDSLSADELQASRARMEAVAGRYGASFTARNGWAAALVGKRAPSFEDLEALARLDHIRPYYHMASVHSVHAGFKGSTSNIGSMGNHGAFAGASNAGLADPGHGALISLAQCSTALIAATQHEPDEQYELLVEMGMMQRLVEDAGEAFLAAHKQLEQEERDSDTHESA